MNELFFDSNIVNTILSKTQVPSLIKSVVDENSDITKINANLSYIQYCPFCHSHKTLIASKDEWKCYACGEGGNAIGFLMKYREIGFVEAIQELGKICKTNIPDIGIKPLHETTKTKRNYEINRIAARYFYQNLRKPENKKAIDYFVNRGVSSDIIFSFGLGYTGKFGDELYKYLTEHKFTETEMMQAGLIAKSQKTGRIYDKFWDRVMFPIRNATGEIIGFGGRLIEGDGPKYLNSQETSVFKKGEHLFCYNLAKKSELEYYICCEGYMDAMSMHQFGFDSAVASLGTALTKDQMKLLSNKPTIYLAYDSDEPGIKAAKRAIELATEMHLNVKVIRMNGAKDPDEFLKKFGILAFEKAIANAEDARHFLIRTSKIDGKITCYDDIVELLL